MNWGQQFADSAAWLAETFGWSLAGFAVVMTGIVRYTRWGRQFAAIAGPYFHPRRSLRPAAIFAAILLLALFSVRLSVLLSYWSNGFYSALQALDVGAFWFFIRLFGVLATIFVVRSLLAFYVQQVFDIHWRTWLTERFLADWLREGAYYKARFLDHPADNPDQRIQADVTTFVTSSRTLSVGAIQAAVSLVAFSAILWNLSAPLPIGGMVLPKAMVFIVYVYVMLATVVAFRLGRPLIRLSFLNEQLGADFRYALVRVKEYAENVAFYRGEAVEGRTLRRDFAAVIANTWAIVYRTLKFSGFNYVVSQLATVFPFLVQAPRFFSGAIKLGDVTQTAEAFGQVQDALSFFRLAYDEFAQYRAVLDRLTGFQQANEAARALPAPTHLEAADGLRIDDLTVRRPDGSCLLRGLALDLPAGESLLIQGASGRGKTTLLRSIAGLWPYATGSVARAGGARAMFLSQRPYLPLGSLAAAVRYPAPDADPERVVQALRRVQLGHLEDRLETVGDWSGVLSLGEQQRLGFARLLVNRPTIAFLDEATSALDEGLEHALYESLRAELPGCQIVSVGHRPTLEKFHDHRLEVVGGGAWRCERRPAALGEPGAAR